MKHRTNNTPPPHHPNYTRTSAKNWISPRTCLTARSITRLRPYHGAHSFYLTEACTLRLTTTTPSLRFPRPNNTRPHINTSRGLRRPESNPTPEDFSLLFNRTSWLNNASCAILTLSYLFSTHYLFHYNLLHIPCV